MSMVPLTFPPCVLLFGCFVKGSFNTQRGVKNLFGQFGVLHPLHPQCGCSSVKMCEQRTWTVCCFLLGPKPITLESIETEPPFWGSGFPPCLVVFLWLGSCLLELGCFVGPMQATTIIEPKVNGFGRCSFGCALCFESTLFTLACKGSKSGVPASRTHTQTSHSTHPAPHIPHTTRHTPHPKPHPEPQTGRERESFCEYSPSKSRRGPPKTGLLAPKDRAFSLLDVDMVPVFVGCVASAGRDFWTFWRRCQPSARSGARPEAKCGLEQTSKRSLWVLSSHLAVGQNGIPFWLVGEFATHFSRDFSGDWDVHWGYRVLTHGHLRASFKETPLLGSPWEAIHQGNQQETGANF